MKTLFAALAALAMLAAASAPAAATPAPDFTLKTLDGPALRALACLSYLAEGGTATPSLKALLQSDLDFTLRQAGRRSIGPWEEPNEFAHHYFVALAQLGALVPSM